MPSFNIIICGAGLGGLAAAIALAQNGHKVIVLEAAKELNEVGAGIQVPPNSIKILEKYKVAHLLEPLATKPKHINMRRYETGEVLNATDLTLMTEAYGYPYWLVHRWDYQKVLLEAALANGAEVRFGQRVASVNPDDALVKLENGTMLSADLVIGADGIRSRVRDTAVVAEEIVLPVPSTNCAYRATLPAKVLIDDPVLRPLMEDVNANCWLGYRRHVMAYPIRNGELYNIVMSHPGVASVGKWSEPGDLKQMRDHYKHFDPVVRRLLSKVDGVLKWVLADLPILPRWVNGRAALIGDAAHAMLPYLAQGAAQSIEDGATIASVLETCKTAEDIPLALKDYEKRRKRRCEVIQQGARANSHIWHMPDGDEQEERDAFMRAPPEEKRRHPNQWSDPKFQKWMFGWDAFCDAYATSKL